VQVDACSAPFGKFTRSWRPHLPLVKTKEPTAPYSLLHPPVDHEIDDQAKIVSGARKTPLTWAFTQNQRADSDRRDDRIEPATPCPQTGSQAADLRKQARWTQLAHLTAHQAPSKPVAPPPKIHSFATYNMLAPLATLMQQHEAHAAALGFPRLLLHGAHSQLLLWASNPSERRDARHKVQ
jgi:hypothetical protein